MKATLTIVAMALTAMAVAPQRGFAQYGPMPYGAYPGPMGPVAPYGVQPAYYPPMAPGGMTAQPPGMGYYPGAAMAYQEPTLAPPGAAPPGAGAYYGPGAPPAGGYGPPPDAAYDSGYTDGGYADGGYPPEGYPDGGITDGAACCDTCDPCAPLCMGGLAPVFFGAEWLLWNRHGQQVPVLVTTGPDGANAANAGVIGQGAVVTFGGDRVDDGFVPGFRITSGIWLDPMHEVAVGGRIFALGQDETNFLASSPTGQPIIARPFLNFADPNNPVEAAFVVAFDDANPATAARTGSLAAQVTSDLWGGDLFSSVMLTQGMGYRVDLQAGYQYYRIDEAVSISSTSVQGQDFFNDNIPNGTTLTLQDVFDTQNEFHGGAFGMLSEMQQGAFSLKVLGRLAVGNMNQRVRVNGNTVITPPPPAMGPPFPPVVFPGGVLVQASNTGDVDRNRTTLVPELGITAGYNITPSATLTLGYSLIYWNHVAQAGPQIDRRIDPNQVNAFPTLGITDSDFWVMGLNGGFEWRY